MEVRCGMAGAPIYNGLIMDQSFITRLEKLEAVVYNSSNLDKLKRHSEELLQNISLSYNETKRRSNEMDGRLKQISNVVQSVIVLRDGLERKVHNVDEEYANFSKAAETYRKKIKAISDAYDRTKSSFEAAEQINEHFKNLLAKGARMLNEIEAIQRHSEERHEKMYLLHKNIYGYEYKDKETGTLKKVAGLKDQLEESYKGLKDELESSRLFLEDLKQKSGAGYKEFLDVAQKEHKDLKSKIESLLPNALTLGLSATYAAKAEKEEKSRFWMSWVFRLYIFLLVLVALVPSGAFCALYKVEKMQLVEVLAFAPKFSLLILPIYPPLIWLAVFANKKINMAKRLVEEYSHKEALSKTYQGLSDQINALPDRQMSEELRVKLLHTIISVNADNPSKCISNCNSSDNPIMETVDKIAEMFKVMDKLKAVPLFHVGSKVVVDQPSEKDRTTEVV